MQRYTFKFQSMSLLALLWALGCSNGPQQGSISERMRATDAETAAAGEQLASETGQPEAAQPEAADDTAMDDLVGGDAPVEAPPTSKKPKKADRADAVVQLDGEGLADEGNLSREDRMLNDLRKDKSLRQQEAEYHAKKGEELFSQGRLEEANQALDQAVAMDPLLDSARAKSNQVKILLGLRTGEIGEVSSSFFETKRIADQQAVEEVKRLLREGQDSMAQKKADEAERAFSRAVDMIKIRPDSDPALRTEALRLLKDSKDLGASLKRERESALRDETDRIARQEVDSSARVKSAQVQELLRKSAEFMRQNDYEKVVEACERVLRIEPDNRVAKFWTAEAKDQIVQERRMRLINARLENNNLTKEDFNRNLVGQDKPFEFPGEDDWSRIQERSRAQGIVDTQDPEPIRRIKNALNDKVDFSFDKASLADAVQQLRTVTGAKIQVDPAIDATTVEVTGTYQGLPAMSVLNLVLESVGLSYTFRENILFITNSGQKGGQPVFGIYNVSDILNKIRDFSGPELILRPAGDTGDSPISFTSTATEEDSQLDPEKLLDLIKNSTGGDERWGEQTIEFHGGQFLVTASRDLHAEIQSVLESLRKDSDLFVVIEARFIDVNDDFLEDIGIDSRALGLANNYGTPFGNVVNDGRTGGQDLGFVKLGSPVRDVTLIMGQDRWAGRVRHIIDGFTGAIRGERLTGGQGIGGLTLQTTFLEPFQINTILRAVQEKLNVRQLTAPIVTAHNGQRVFVSVITQRAYIADYNLVSGGTGFAIIEVADPEVQTFQEGVILDVDPVISHDKKYVTLDVRPTLATLIGGIISTILISLGSFTNVANQVPIGVPEISLQQSFTSVTVPNGGTVLLGGFKSLNETKLTSYLPILGKIPIIGNLFRRKSQVQEKRSLVILLTARIVDLRESEQRQFNTE